MTDHKSAMDLRYRNDFIEDVMKYKDQCGTACKFTACRYAHPHYRSLTERELEYYFYWRTSLLEGTYIPADTGFLYLFVVESLVLNRPSDVIMGALREARSTCTFEHHSLSSLISEVCMHFGIPYPDWMELLPYEFKDMMRANLITSPICRISSAFRRLAGHEYLELGDGVITDDILSSCLAEIDRHLSETTGKTLLETYSEGDRKIVWTIFDKYQIPQRRRMVSVYKFLGGRFDRFLEGLASCIIEEFDLSRYYHPVRGFPAEFREIVRRLAQTPDELPLRPSSERAPLPIREACETDSDGMLYPQRLPDHRTFSPKFKNDIAENRHISGYPPCDYVPSGIVKPQYRHLMKDQLSFYYYWRDCVRNGRYPATDTGYLWLHICEEINDPDPPEIVFERMCRLVEAYSGDDRSAPGPFQYFNIRHLRRACLDYALFHDLPIPEKVPCRNVLGVTLRFLQFLEHGEGSIERDILAGMAGLGKSDNGKFDEDAAAIASSAILRLDRLLEKGICRSSHMEFKTVKYGLFEDVLFYGWPAGPKKKSQYTIPLLYENDIWKNTLADILKEATLHVRMHKGIGRKKPGCCHVFGIDAGPLLAEETRKHFRRRSAPADFKLDSDMIRTAQVDLDYVSSVLSTEETEDVVRTEPLPEPEPATGGWSGFIASLDESEKEHLRMLVSAKTASVDHPGSRTSRGRIEDAINEKAMDCIGDIVVEDGAAVEDYLSALSSILG